jgi:hypothetical protein
MNHPRGSKSDAKGRSGCLSDGVLICALCREEGHRGAVGLDLHDDFALDVAVRERLQSLRGLVERQRFLNVDPLPRRARSRQ